MTLTPPRLDERADQARRALPGEARVLQAAERSLSGERRG
ncbi:MAG: hypothetical protein QOH15_52, partial [Gaiellales bacterium]|nr:hypothetical protein [Gaiellales bacterium]